MQVLESDSPSPSISEITIDGNYARGFLISTKETSDAPEGRFRINKETGHEQVKTFLQTHFMIDHQLLDSHDDGHFYGHGLDNLLEGYKKRSHGIIEKLYGPFYYGDTEGNYWYEYGMRLRDSGATAALEEYGKRSWEPFSVSPHIWDYPELGQDPLNLKKWRGVGVALVMKGAFGNQAVISRLCKGSSDVCYSDKGLGATLKQECSAGCQCSICQKDDRYLVNLLTSHLGKTGSSRLNNSLEPPNNGNLTNLDSKIDPNKQVPTLESQLAITEAQTKAQLEKELEEYKRKAKEEAEREYKDVVTALKNKDKMRTLNEIFNKDIVPDDNARKITIDKYKDLDLDVVDSIKAAIEDYRPHLETSLKKRMETEKPDAEAEDKPEGGDQPKAEKVTETGKKGKSGSELPPEPKHPLPKEDVSAPDTGKAGSGSTVNRLARLRSGMIGRTF